MANGDSFDRMEKIAKTWSQKAKGRRAGGEQGVEEFPSFSPGPARSPLQPRIPSTHLSTDSTNTLRAFMWIQAIKASLKFTLSQRSRGPCGDGRTA